MDILNLQVLMARIGKDFDATTPLSNAFMAEFLAELTRFGCDRIPVKVRNLDEPFYLAGADRQHVFLSHAVTCVLSTFTYDDLEPVYRQTAAEIYDLVACWFRSPEFAAAQDLAVAAASLEEAGKHLPVTLHWPKMPENSSPRKARQGLLTGKSTTLGEASTCWVVAVEMTDTRDVTYRYGMTRLGKALHDGKKLTMMLHPSTPY